MKIDDAIEQLNALTDENPERAHKQADEIIVEAMRENGMIDLANAYVSARERVGFWYA